MEEDLQNYESDLTSELGGTPNAKTALKNGRIENPQMDVKFGRLTGE
ncbi:unnamed protein product, partial [Allacma fusca]